jgi:arginine exporter protein ArgO
MKADCSSEMSAARANCSKAPQAKGVFVVYLLLKHLYCSCVIMSGVNGRELSCMPNVCFTLSDVLTCCVYCLLVAFCGIGLIFLLNVAHTNRIICLISTANQTVGLELKVI